MSISAFVSSAAKLGVASAAPAAAAAARAPIVNDSEGDLIALDGPNPSQAPVFLDLDGEGPASMTTPSGDAFDVQDPLAALAKIEESESAGCEPASSLYDAALCAQEINTVLLSWYVRFWERGHCRMHMYTHA